MARLLVYTATYDDALRPETAASVNAQVYDGELVYEISYHNPFPTTKRDMRNVLAQYQRARQMTLDGGYDALLIVEHDMEIPPDTAQRMMDTDAPVVYAPYLLRHGSNVLSLWQWTGGKNLGMSLTLYPHELDRYRKAGVGPVCGVGFGCTLIRRAVLERIGFRGPDDAAPDLPFAMDCIRAGIRPLGRFDIECGHYERGQWLWPWRQTEGEAMGRIYMLQTVNANVNGNSQQLKRGHYYTLSGTVRDDLIRAGYATHLDTEAEPHHPPGTDGHDRARELAVAASPVEVADAPQAKVQKRKPRKPKAG